MKKIGLDVSCESFPLQRIRMSPDDIISDESNVEDLTEEMEDMHFDEDWDF